MLEIIEKGGIMMYPIIISSIIALAVIFDRAYIFFIKTKSIPKDSMDQMFDLVKKGKKSDAETIIESDPSVFSVLFLSIFRQNNPEDMEIAAVSAGDRILFSLSQRLSILSVIGSVVPLMGLLGTVLGMIKVFARVAHAGDAADITVLAGGIWEALITTAAGMAVAIPVMLIHHYFSRNIQKAAHSMQQDATMLIAGIKKSEAS